MKLSSYKSLKDHLLTLKFNLLVNKAFMDKCFTN